MALAGWAALSGCVRRPESARSRNPVDAADSTTEPGRKRNKFARCLPADRSFAVGEGPVDLAVLSRADGAPALVVANASSNDLSLVRREGHRWREVQRVSTAPAAVQGRLHVHPTMFPLRPPGPRPADGIRSMLAFDVDRDGDDEVVVEREGGCMRLVLEEGALQLRPLKHGEAAPRVPCGPDRGRVAPAGPPRRKELGVGFGGAKHEDRVESEPPRDGPELVAPPPIPRGHDNLISVARMLGPVRRSSGGPDDFLMSVRDAHRASLDGADFAQGEPELSLYLVREGDEPIQLGKLTDDPGESAGSYLVDMGRMSKEIAHSSDVAALASGDLDGDGDIEIVVVDRRRHLYALWGRGDAEFAPPVRWHVGHVLAMAVRDLDGDGADELVTLSDREAALKIFTPAGPGGPGPAVVFGTGAGTHRFVVADVDDDRKPELVLADRFTGTLEVLPWRPCEREQAISLSSPDPLDRIFAAREERLVTRPEG